MLRFVSYLSPVALLAVIVASSPALARAPMSDIDRDGHLESISKLEARQSTVISAGESASGRVVRTIPTPGPNCQGLTYDGQYLWTSDIGTDRIYQIDANDGSVRKSFPAPGEFCEGLAWDGEALWASDNDGDRGGIEMLYRIDPSSGAVLESMPAATLWIHGITFDGNDLWAADFVGSIRELDKTSGAALASIPPPTNLVVGLSWDGQYLWSGDFNSDRLYQIDRFDGTVVKIVPSPHTNPRDLAWDGEYLWVLTGFDGHLIYQVDVSGPGVACNIEQHNRDRLESTSGDIQGLGQTFTACSDGLLARVVVDVDEESTSLVTFGISIGDTDWAPVYTQTVVLYSRNNSTILLKEPFRVENGRIYTFGLIPISSGILSLWQGADGYPGGKSVALAGSTIVPSTTPGDLSFGLTVDWADVTPPTLSVELDPAVLWPPNHKLIDVHATVVITDDTDPDPRVVLTSITWDEAGAGAVGDGNVKGAEYGTADVDFQLRAERGGPGDGRLYAVTYEARDGSGNVATATAYVRTPHDQRENGPQHLSVDNPLADGLSVVPNPFNPSTTIRFRLEDPGVVTLHVYNAQGILVNTLLDQTLLRGVHLVPWNGVDENGARVSSGVYFLRLIAGGSSITRKVVVLK